MRAAFGKYGRTIFIKSVAHNQKCGSKTLPGRRQSLKRCTETSFAEQEKFCPKILAYV